MRIMIATANKKLVQELNYGKALPKEQVNTENTLTFEMSPKKFEQLRVKASNAGFNVYALFYW